MESRLSLKACRGLLGTDGSGLPDQQLQEFRDELDAIASVAVSAFERDSEDAAEAALWPALDPAMSRMRPRCGAKARTRAGQPCQRAPVKGKKRCRFHGGLSTGPRTPEGLAHSRRARWVHGRRSREAIEARRQANWETWERAKPRLERAWRRADRRGVVSANGAPQEAAAAALGCGICDDGRRAAVSRRRGLAR